MNHLKYRYLRLLRNRGSMFWTLLYPMILATFMYFAFGNISTSSFDVIPVAVVDAEENSAFRMMLEEAGELADARYMTEAEAQTALEEGEVKGIFFASDAPTLTVAENGTDETILAMLLDAYYKNAALFGDLYGTHPEHIADAAQVLNEFEGDSAPVLREVSLGGKTYNTWLEYFFACLAMTCFFGSFIGIDLAEEFAANISALGARRSVSPAHKLKALVSDLFVALSVQSVNALLLLLYMQYVLRIDFSGNLFYTFLVCVAGSLVGIAFGMLTGASSRLPAAAKMVLIVGVPLVSSFLAGLMYGGMKYVIEKRAPLVNRLNPSALISDALYYLNVYDDRGTMWARIGMLVLIGAILTLLSFASLWRTRYESI